MTNKIVITRHPALISYLEEIGLISEGTPVYAHATPELVKDKQVIGILPLYLAVLTETITEIPLNIPQELRGQELSLEQIRQYADAPRTYAVFHV